MPLDLQKDKNLVPARIAARESDYTTDYITLLAREGKIFAKKIGRQWHVDLNEVLQFAYRQNKDQITRQAQLKAERKIEYALHAKDIHHEIAARIENGKRSALLAALCIVVIMLSTGTFGYYSSNKDQLASLPSIDISFLEHTAVALYKFVTPESWYAKTDSHVVSENNLSDAQESRSYNLIAAPSIEDEQAILRDAFSDKLEVVFDTELNDSGVIQPDFKSGIENKYRFKIFLEEMVGSSS